MSARGEQLRRAFLPAGVFLCVALVHYAWLAVFPERDPVQARWALPENADSSSLRHYVETQSHWLGLSYAVALAFAATAFRRYREDGLCTARTVAIGGVSLSGFLAVAGCYVVGCCGSPMLAVYVGLFGAHFLPVTKPLVAAFTLVSVVVAWWWMSRARGSHTLAAGPAAGCGCEKDPPAASRATSTWR